MTCSPFNDPSSSSSSGAFAAIAAAPGAAQLRATAILPDRASPAVFRRIHVAVPSGGVGRLVVPELGWLVIFWSSPSLAMGSAVTDPGVQPVDFPGALDGAVAAGVYLPQSAGLNQYWVAITDSQPWMQLKVDEWIVMFVKLRA